jgi:hypothetical protein
MKNRKGEKLGWSLGWSGCFLWVLVLSVIFIFQGESLNGILGVVIVLMAAFFVIKRSPWKNPDTEYWKLYAPLINTFIISILWAVLASQNRPGSEINWGYLFFVTPLLIPLFILGKRKWNDKDVIAGSTSDEVSD